MSATIMAAAAAIRLAAIVALACQDMLFFLLIAFIILVSMPSINVSTRLVRSSQKLLGTISGPGLSFFRRDILVNESLTFKTF